MKIMLFVINDNAKFKAVYILYSENNLPIRNELKDSKWNDIDIGTLESYQKEILINCQKHFESNPDVLPWGVVKSSTIIV